MNQAMTKDQLTQAMIDPASMFPNPMAIVGDERLSSDQKDRTSQTLGVRRTGNASRGRGGFSGT